MSDGTKYNYIANSIIVLLIWLLLWNFGIIFYEVYQGIVSFCKWLKVKCGKTDKWAKEDAGEEDDGDGSDRAVEFPKRQNYFRLGIRGFTKYFNRGKPEPAKEKI
jgi:hypothetical protein